MENNKLLVSGVVTLNSLTHTKNEIIGIAARLLTDDAETRESLASELLEIAKDLHEEETVLFRKCRNEESPSHPGQG